MAKVSGCEEKTLAGTISLVARRQGRSVFHLSLPGAVIGLGWKCWHGVYAHDTDARERGLTPIERLRFHRQHSGPVMEEMHRWLETQFAQKRVEPNSGLGQAITYLLRHWRGLTTFLRKANAPLDNNLCERALKRAMLYRKNSLFYKTLNGAQAGDFVHESQSYLRVVRDECLRLFHRLQKHASKLARKPAECMP